jgi:hypothetical protein
MTANAKQSRRTIPGRYFNQTARSGWVSTKTSGGTLGFCPDEMTSDYRQGSTFLKLFTAFPATASVCIGEFIHHWTISFRTPKPPSLDSLSSFSHLLANQNWNLVENHPIFNEPTEKS